MLYSPLMEQRETTVVVCYMIVPMALIDESYFARVFEHAARLFCGDDCEYIYLSHRMRIKARRFSRYRYPYEEVQDFAYVRARVRRIDKS